MILRAGFQPSDELGAELRDHVAHAIGPIAKPKTVLFTEELPKTRSGKIMRRLLRNVAEDEALGDTTTLADPSVVEGIKARYLVVGPAGTTREHRTRSSPPSTGRWRDEPVEPGPAAVVDIDGVLSDAREPSALHRGAAPRLGSRSSRRAATTRSSRR